VKHAEALTEWLQGAGLEVAKYHGRMTARQRHEAQERFMRGELKAIIATNAFGMGIDKPDIRFVVHYDLPGSLDAYYQESGRAGRDGASARCVLLFLKSDQRTHLFFMGRKYPRFNDIATVQRALAARAAGAAPVAPDALAGDCPGVGARKLSVVLSMLSELGEVACSDDGIRLASSDISTDRLTQLAAAYEARQRRDRDKLDEMIAYAQSALCRWHLILRAFGESLDGESCGDCDNCRHDAARTPLAAAS
jgi:ATP-dependent DNA helicase RecQ